MRTKNAVLNFLSGTMPSIIIAIIGIFKIRMFLDYMGSDTVGMYQLFSQFFTYLTILEAGLTSNAVYLLYKPITEKNQNKINKILSGVKSYFNKLATIFIIIGFIFSFFVMFFIKETNIDSSYIQISLILYIISASITYYSMAHSLYFRAEQKVYKIYTVHYGITIIKNIVEIILVALGFNLLTLMIAYLVSSLIYNIILIKISKKDHKELNLNTDKDYTFTKEMKNLSVGRIGGLIYKNIDMVIISKFMGLVYVVTYTSYYYIFNMMQLMVSQCGSALIPGFGEMIHTETKEKVKEVFTEFNNIIFFFATIITVPLSLCITPFIKLWYGNEYTVNALTSNLMMVLFFMNIAVIPLTTLIDSTGNFKSIKNNSIIQSIINLSLSLILIQYLGIAGVILATIISLIFGTFTIFPKVIFEKEFKSKKREYYNRVFKYIIIALTNSIIINIIFKSISIDSLLIWFIIGVASFIINFILTLGMYYFFKEIHFKNRIINYKNSIRKK